MTETFVLRVYDSGTQTNYPVAPLVCQSFQHHSIDLDTLSATFAGAIYQIYPGRPNHCMYDPLPPQMRWYLVTNTGQTLVVIDNHDQYAYFKIPAQTKELHWIMAQNPEQVKTMLSAEPK